MFALMCTLISAPFTFLVAPYDPLAGNEASFEGFVGLFSDIRSSAGLAGVAVVAAIFLILAPLNALLASLYGLYLTFVGVREMHGTSTGRALVVIALPVVLFVIVAVLPLFPQSG